MQLTKNNGQVLMLYAATFAGALLNFVASKINTDYLSPAEYGDVRYVLNIIQLISWIVLFGWFVSGSRLLALSDDESYSARIRGALILLLAFASTILVSITAATGLFHHGKSTYQLFFYALPVCFYPLLTNYMNTTAQGDNHIGRLSLARLLPVMVYIVTAILLYSRKGTSAKEVLMLHWGICSIVLIVIIISSKPSFCDIKPVLQAIRKENRSYGIHLYWGSMAMVATNYLAGVTLGAMSDDNTSVGFYTLALSLAQPLSYLPGIVGTAYFKRFVHETSIPRKVMLTTVAITIVSCIGFILLIKPVVRLYDDSYSAVAGYAAILALGFSIHGVGDMINRYLGSHGEGLCIRNSSFACGAVKIIGSFILVWLWNVNGAILTMVLSSFVYTISLYFAYRSFTRKKGPNFVAD